MIKKIILFPFLILVISVNTVKADEGMWLPLLLKALCEKDMQAKGLKLSAEDVYSINKSSLKDAIVIFGGGCTGEVVSDKGLLFTNHHCGISQVQYHSTVDNDYIKNGFWAKTQADELPNQGLTVTFIVRIEDVTEKVKGMIAGATTPSAIREKINEIQKAAVEGTHYDAEIKAFDYGNAYYMFVTETFKDIRLVGAPPQAVGEFGGDTDNWMWPRHTGDFTVFRIYAGKDNKPAEYSSDNVPYKPKYSLSISTDGVKEGDFAMVYGFPGRTQQYLPAAAVDFIINESNPAKIMMRDHALEVINKSMQESDKVRIQYTAKESRISNSWKKWKGENMGLKKTNAVEKKKSLEAEFNRRVYENAGFAKKYGTLVESFAKLYANGKEAMLAYDYFNELYYSSGPELFKFIGNFEKLVNTYETFEKEGKSADNKEAIERIKRSADAFYKNFDLATDKKLFERVIPVYLKYCPPEYLPTYLLVEVSKKKNSITALSDEIYNTSVFTSPEKVEEGFKNPKAFITKIKADKGYKMMVGLLDVYRKKLEAPVKTFSASNEQLMNQYVAAIYEVFPEKKIWYDANSTMRIGYGLVEGSYPKDGLSYTYYTTTDGILEKYQSGAAEYVIPPKLLELISKKDFGNYADKDGTLHTCFTASAQTTGGNSGSPVLNGNGELIGLNFDRSWESTMSDIMYSPKLCRNIVCDIRYVLFIIDKYAGASNLLTELKLVNTVSKEKARIEGLKKEIEDITEQLRINPDNPAMLTNRGRNYYELGLYEDALKNTAAALTAKKDFQPAILLNAQIYAKQGRMKDAISNAEKAVTLDLADIKAKKTLARLRFEERNMTACITVCEQILKVEQDPEIMLLMARAHYLRGADVDACKWYKQSQQAGSKTIITELETCE